MPAAFVEGLGLLRTGGRFLVVGPTHDASVSVRPMLMIAKEPTIIGVRGASIGDYHRALLLMDRHSDRFDWDDMITSTRPLNEINTAMRSMQLERGQPAVPLQTTPEPMKGPGSVSTCRSTRTGLRHLGAVSPDGEAVDQYMGDTGWLVGRESFGTAREVVNPSSRARANCGGVEDHYVSESAFAEIPTVGES